MTEVRWIALLPIAALVGVGVAIWTGSPVFAAFCAAAGALAAGAFLLLANVDRIRWGLPGPPEVEGDTLALLERSFREGQFGRRAILARLAGLEGGLPADPSRRLAEESAILGVPDPAFLDYVEARIAEVERRT